MCQLFEKRSIFDKMIEAIENTIKIPRQLFP